jgi:hypothetical protein
MRIALDQEIGGFSAVLVRRLMRKTVGRSITARIACLCFTGWPYVELSGRNCKPPPTQGWEIFNRS